MKTYIDLEKGIAYGTGKAREFRKSKSIVSVDNSGQSKNRVCIDHRSPSAAQNHSPSVFTTILRELDIYYVGGGCVQ